MHPITHLFTERLFFFTSTLEFFLQYQLVFTDILIITAEVDSDISDNCSMLVAPIKQFPIPPPQLLNSVFVCINLGTMMTVTGLQTRKWPVIKVYLEKYSSDRVGEYNSTLLITVNNSLKDSSTILITCFRQYLASLICLQQPTKISCSNQSTFLSNYQNYIFKNLQA